jgi:hypothetical protein
MGADLVYNKLLARIVNRDEVADASLQVGAARGKGAAAGPFYSANIATDGRKARVEMNNVFVGLMGEAVVIDLLVLVEEKPGATEGKEITPPLNAAVETDLKASFAAATGKLLKSDLRSLITSTLAGAAPGLQLLTNNAVVVNALYEESGRLLNNTDEVPVESHQVLTLGSLKVQLQGALDG